MIPAPEDDEEGVEPVELRRLGELLVDARLPAQALADEVGGGQRQDGGREERGVEQAEGEERRAVLPGQRRQGQGRVRGRLDLDPAP